ncbi:hypothetical protein GP486_000252 [Trichoglossum hirsutum]|uniref:Uncharacterized protein n=1 Tax=Trichoglossum hirsutum TaxID=265104 RepID=A0A9P8LIX5_9PEZI|nr:hypothetical protein GP486_000252 [Trichoglossum hirsutum]
MVAFDNSARKVPLQHMLKLVQTAAGNPPNPPKLDKNQIQLYSYFVPGLLADVYSIKAEQRITAQNGDWGEEHYHVYNRLRDPNNTPDRTKFQASPNIEPQEFEVIAPQFNIDTKLINSYYPPDGHQDECRILPHICLSDPHLPWERRADVLDEQLQDQDKIMGADGKPVVDSKGPMRNAIPWVALMVFDHEDLPPLTEADAGSLGPTPNSPPVWLTAESLQKQAANGAFQMTVGNYLDIPQANRVNFEKGTQKERDAGEDPLLELKYPSDTSQPPPPMSQERMTAIFPKKKMFKKLFPDIAGLRYAAHVRNINTTGFPDAGIDQLGLYSIVISSRTGAYLQTKPVTQICHLVSVEHFKTTLQNLQGDDEGRIGLISLFSWTYTALPPNPVNFVDSITNVLKGRQMLRAPWETRKSLKKQAQAVTDDSNKVEALNALVQRFEAGYTLARWRAETGEETVAFNRGPLVPKKSPYTASSDPNAIAMGVAPVRDWPFSSNTSKEYQILDSSTGILDLSYSSAWQLGKTLAISDTSFSSALSRLRSWIQKWSQSKTRSEVNAVPSRKALISNMPSNFTAAVDLSAGEVADPRRIPPPVSRELAPGLDHPDIAPIFDQNIRLAVQQAGSAGDEIYNEFNKTGHNNTDWTVIHQWISEKLYLSDIPAHVLIPDPSFLPEESIRFFHIDDAWLDCLIDGALSVANHLERDDDKIRNEIKQIYNSYLRDPVGATTQQPQIPGYGFILRSQIVKVMPDLKITAVWQPVTNDNRHPVCRYTRPDDHTILCLLDRPPEELKWIELAQPPHQQRFAFGFSLAPSFVTDKNGFSIARPDKQTGQNAWQFEFKLREMYTDGTQPNPDADGVKKWATMDAKHQPLPWEDVMTSWLPDHNARVINFAVMAPAVNDLVRNGTTQGPGNTAKSYEDFVGNSAELAMELNDPSYFFRILPDPGTKNSQGPFPPRNRQLWCPKVLPPADTTIVPVPASPPDSKPIGPSILPPKGQDQPSTLHHIRNDAPDKANNVIFKDTPAVPANPSQPLGTSQPTTCFNVQIYADYKGPPTIHTDDNAFDKNNYLATQNVYLYDLIFSVRKLPTKAKADYRLREIIINLPRDNIAAPAEPLINSGSPTPRARVLSNQRFVPFLNWTKEYLQVRLVPRSAEDHPVIVINDRRTKEVSFRLEEVDIMPIRTKVWVPIHGGPREQLGVCKVMVYERYETPAGVVSAAPAPTNVFLVKRDVTDELKYA